MLNRLLKYSAPSPSGCRLWGGAKNHPGGYGIITIGKKPVLVHRAMYEATHGPIPATQIVMHVCDTPLCIEPTHLQIGTMRDNARDMARKGRGANHLGNYGKKDIA